MVIPPNARIPFYPSALFWDMQGNPVEHAGTLILKHGPLLLGRKIPLQAFVGRRHERDGINIRNAQKTSRGKVWASWAMSCKGMAAWYGMEFVVVHRYLCCTT